MPSKSLTDSSLIARWSLEAWMSEPPHTAARVLGRAAAGQLDDVWRRPRCKKAPFDVVDLFCGCGGLSAGFDAVARLVPSYALAAAADLDTTATESYRRNLGVTPKSLDVHDVAEGRAELRLGAERHSPRPLITIGGPPCQGFSSHRNRVETDGRNSLLVDCARAAIRLGSEAVVIENVPELLTERHFGFLQAVRELLEDEGYFVNVSVHNAADFYVPQERFRALILAARTPFRPLRGYLDRDRYRTVRDAIAGLPAVAPGQKFDEDPLHFTAAHKASTVETIRQVPLDGGNRPDGVGPASLRRAAAKNGKPAYEDVYGRLYWDRPSITVTAHARNPASGRYVHPEQHRGLSVREAALLQGFPSSWELTGSLDDGFRQLGNAVPPPFAAAVASHLLGELAEPAEEPSFDPGITAPVGLSFSRLIPALKSGARQL